MTFLTANNAVSKLASALSASATSLTVTAGHGAKFPSPTGGDFFPLTLLRGDGTQEIVRCTARSGDVLTVTRAQESTSGITFSAGDRVELRLTAGLLELLKATDLQAYTKTNILGTVSQAAGVPTGAIFEVGTNGNGRYIKYADGTMYCEGTFTRNPFAVTSGVGPFFYGFTGAWSYPAPFVGGTPFSQCMPIANGQVLLSANRAIIQTNAAVEFIVLSPVSYTQDTTLICRAWGRWY